jgi:outer membrane protein insertion porin family
MKKPLLIILFFCVTFFGFSQIRLGGVTKKSFKLDYSNPTDFEIGGITVSGVNFLDESALISLSGLKVGDKITIPGDDVTNAIKKLWAQGILGNVELRISKIEGNYVFLDFKLEEKPRLTKFAFEGVKKSEADEIREKITLIRGRTVTDALVNRAEVKIKRYYVEKGFRNVDVNISQLKDTVMPNSVILLIKVDKKEKVKIADIIFSGINVFESNKLKRKMKDTKIAKPYRIFKTSKVLPGAVERDKQKIVDLYHEHGYRDASIVSDTIIDVSTNRVLIKMDIDEGTQYRFGKITWKGNFIYDDAQLAAILGIEEGSIYNKDLLDKRLNFNPTGRDITSQYMDDGYLFFNIQPVEIDVRGDSIDLEMRIYEGEQATISKIIINGNTKTSDHVVRREIRTVPGEKFSRTNIIRTQRELSQLGYFEPESMGITPIPHPETGTVDIVYDLTEKANDQFTLSGGYGGFQGFVGTAGLVFNNFSAKKLFKFKEYDPLPGGDGQRLSVQANANMFMKGYNFSFTEPWLGGKKPNAFTVSFNHSVTRFGGFGMGGGGFGMGGGFGGGGVWGAPDENAPLIKITGGTLHLGKRLRIPDDFFQQSNAVSLQRYTLANAGGIFPIANGQSYNLSLNNTISRYSVGNRPEFPTYGSSISLSTSVTPPYSLFSNIDDYDALPDEERYKLSEYHKWMFDATWYNTLIKGKKQDYNLVLRTSFHAGYLGTYNKRLGHTPFERFIMGGSGMAFMQQGFLMGYDIIGLRGFPDQNPALRGDGTNPIPNSGGTKFAKFVAEVRYPISLNPMATVYPIAFLDMGNNWNEFRNVDFFNLYKSAGLGVRIFMPMFGMIGFDYGVNLDTYSADVALKNRGVFHFIIGQQFR